MAKAEELGVGPTAISLIGLLVLTIGLFLVYSSTQVAEAGASSQHAITLIGIFISLIGGTMLIARKS